MGAGGGGEQGGQGGVGGGVDVQHGWSWGRDISFFLFNANKFDTKI